MHAKNSGGGGGAAGTQTLRRSRQGDGMALHARANVFQDGVPSVGGGGAAGLHPVYVSVSGSIVTDCWPWFPSTTFSTLQLVGSASRPEKSVWFD